MEEPKFVILIGTSASFSSSEILCHSLKVFNFTYYGK
jgi:hypothetical protein